MNINSRIALLLAASWLVSGCSLLTHNTIVFEGTSMLPTIKNGDKVQTIRLNAESRAKLVRGEIIAFRYPKDPSKGYVKRLIGLPGDTIEIRKDEVWVNGIRLLEPYVEPKFNMSQRSLPPVSIPQQAYYVLGDNRDNSSDSRIWGWVPAELVYAKAVNH
ncbi:MAG TPA: signal peptidase I [Pyrinomonadaceae bacterium]|nr:signal peptidase I [Pyrinomonadaceae bacterium]